MQQLWKYHKRVCGSNANPFLWPPLSAEEAREAKATRDVPANLLTRGTTKGLYSYLRGRYAYESEEHLENCIDLLSIDAGDDADDFRKQPTNQFLIGEIRYHNLMRKAGAYSPLDKQTDVWIVTTELSRGLFTQLIPYDDKDVVLVRHHLLAYATICMLARTGKLAAFPGSERWTRRVLDNLLALLQTVKLEGLRPVDRPLILRNIPLYRISLEALGGF